MNKTVLACFRRRRHAVSMVKVILVIWMSVLVTPCSMAATHGSMAGTHGSMAGTHGSMAATHGLNDSQSVGVQGVDHDCPAAPTLDPMTESDCCCTVTVIASDVAQKLLNPAILIAIPYVIDTFEAKPPSEDGFAFENVRTLARSPPVYLVTQRVRI